MTYCGLYI